MALDFSKCKILIVGDIMLDKYYFGRVERISPEAPVPIVNIQKEETRLGGASNVANNICSLGAQAMLYGAIGHDFFGKEIERLTRKKNIGTTFIKSSSPTITKARIIGGKQQIVRLDYEEKLTLTESEIREFKEQVRANLPDYQVLVISDYGKGFISDELCKFLILEAHRQELKVIVDPKGKKWEKYEGADLITPNLKELGDIAGHAVANSDEEVTETAGEVLRQHRLNALLVTRSEKGMSLIAQQSSLHIPTHSEEVFDVSGAGDTVVATLSICLAAGFDMTQAIRMANVAAGVVVRKIGTATLTTAELEANLSRTSK